MTEPGPTPPPPDDPQKQLKDLLKNANFSFVFEPGAMLRGGAGAAPENDEEKQRETEEALRRIREFHLRPREVRDYLDRFVIRQDEAKKVLSVAICDHYNHVRRCLEDPNLREQEYAKQNILLLGPTGVGKTYLMRCIARLIGVPFAKADATKFSETGYVGYDVEDMVRDLVKLANGDTDLAQYGIIYIDEIDKIASTPGQVGRDVSGRGVQINLLKLMEDTEVNLHSQTDLVGQMQSIMEMQRGGKPRKRTLNTRHILFIVSGAFDKLTDLVKSRVLSTRIGFAEESEHAVRDESEFLRQAQTADFIKYGFEPEFIGRLPVRVVCDALTRHDLEQILLKSEGSVLNQYRGDFHGYGIDLAVGPDAVSEIAAQAEAEKTGARGLMTVLERVLRNFKFELPSTTVKALALNRSAVEDPSGVLAGLLKQGESAQRELLRQEVAAFARRFLQEHGVTLEFEPDAVEALVDLSLANHKTIRGLCEDKFRDYQFGLKLAARNSGQAVFRVGRRAVEAPDEELSRWVVESYPTRREPAG
jgi:ATP-dependent Clp protease ATP-binding subunit ClpX